MAPLLGLGAQVEFVSKIIFMRSPKPPSHNYKSLMISRLGCTKQHAVTRYISPSEVELSMEFREISQCLEETKILVVDVKMGRTKLIIEGHLKGSLLTKLPANY